jgi:hypothetical protein
MKIRIADENIEAEKLLPPTKPDGSLIGINYASAYLKSINHTLEDGRKISCKRRGLKITLSIGDKKGEGLMRRIENGPTPQNILAMALKEAAQNAGATFSVENGGLFLELN